jgi:hypothetical protein
MGLFVFVEIKKTDFKILICLQKIKKAQAAIWQTYALSQIKIKIHQHMYWWRRWESNPRPKILALKLLRV